ncbi:site-specific DNA-methyltransferase [Mannheimia sp. E30BD]|uniref:site-specific DNA-methyltransferase n=1 Tax=Mannheimia sp. E30BD TaxID=3278708 RepID=UPI00359DF5B4
MPDSRQPTADSRQPTADSRQPTADSSASAETLSDVKQNLIIQGDNLSALKSLLPFYAGQVKCIFIDPPYNTKSAFTHYDDNLEHSVWLSMMYPRLEILRELLAEDGSIWITLDDNESHYLKIMLDEIFGRKNFVANVVWQHSIQGKNDSKLLSIHHNQLLVFRKSDSFRRNLLPRQEEHNINYKNPDNDPRGAWRSGDFRSPNLRENLRYDIVTPNGNTISPPEKGWRWSKDTFFEKVKTGEISFIENETKVLRKIYLSEQEGRIPETIWFGKEVGTTRDANNEIKNIFNSAFFETPKPELLIQRVLQIATSENDLVLDSFLGSGTTAAVAHKMNRRYIGIEIGEHAKTHVVPRLKKVIEGEQGGISKAVNWQGGGSFRFCELGEEVFDAFGSLNPNIRFDDLAAHIWYLENHFPLQKNSGKSPLVGTFNGKAYYLLYNGILGDKRPQSGNVLTRKLMTELPYFAEFIQQGVEIVIYGEACRLGEAQLAEKKITFKQIPYDVTAR